MLRKKIIIPLLILIIIPVVYMKMDGHASDTEPAVTPTFNEYWYSGLAELNRFALEQERYGEIRKGDAVLVFVTEDFFADKQVKYEFGSKPDQVKSVLKLNFIRKFETGIYPYSMMTSIFTPIDPREGRTYKITTSVQEWCGHTFMQLNRQKEGYRGELRSYFQGEGDRQFDISGMVLEDALWTQIRLNPGDLPTGMIEIVPGTQYQRLAHIDSDIQTATAKITRITDKSISDQEVMVYELIYNNIPRSLMIYFEPEFPYSITGWQENWGNDQKLSARAVRTNVMRLDYWNKNGNNDSHYRKELGLATAD